MSKKLAAGSDVIVLDVKTGSGAFMKSYEDSLALAKEMVQIGTIAGKKTYAVITDMNQPLGYAVGNTLEVIEAIDTLNGKGPEDLLEVSLALASLMLVGAGAAPDTCSAKQMLLKTIEDKRALNKFAEFIAAQGGDSSYVYNTDKFDKASLTYDITAESDGYVSSIRTDEVGMASLLLGGGRETKDSIIDLTVGIIIRKKLGDRVKAGDILARLYANDQNRLVQASERLRKAFTIQTRQPNKQKHVYAIVTSNGVEELN